MVSFKHILFIFMLFAFSFSSLAVDRSIIQESKTIDSKSVLTYSNFKLEFDKVIDKVQDSISNLFVEKREFKDNRIKSKDSKISDTIIPKVTDFEQIDLDTMNVNDTIKNEKTKLVFNETQYTTKPKLYKYTVVGFDDRINKSIYSPIEVVNETAVEYDSVTKEVKVNLDKLGDKYMLTGSTKTVDTKEVALK